MKRSTVVATSVGVSASLGGVLLLLLVFWLRLWRRGVLVDDVEECEKRGYSSWEFRGSAEDGTPARVVESRREVGGRRAEKLPSKSVCSVGLVHPESVCEIRAQTQYGLQKSSLEKRMDYGVDCSIMTQNKNSQLVVPDGSSPSIDLLAKPLEKSGILAKSENLMNGKVPIGLSSIASLPDWLRNASSQEINVWVEQQVNEEDDEEFAQQERERLLIEIEELRQQIGEKIGGSSPSPSLLPTIVRVDSVAEDLFKKDEEDRRRRNRVRPSPGDLALIRVMEPNRPDVAQLVGERALNSDSESDSDEDMEDLLSLEHLVVDDHRDKLNGFDEEHHTSPDKRHSNGSNKRPHNSDTEERRRKRRCIDNDDNDALLSSDGDIPDALGNTSSQGHHLPSLSQWLGANQIPDSSSTARRRSMDNDMIAILDNHFVSPWAVEHRPNLAIFPHLQEIQPDDIVRPVIVPPLPGFLESSPLMSSPQPPAGSPSECHNSEGAVPADISGQMNLVENNPTVTSRVEQGSCSSLEHSTGTSSFGSTTGSFLRHSSSPLSLPSPFPPQSPRSPSAGVETVVEQSLFTCTVCGINFVTVGLRNNHINRKHVRRFQCSAIDCGAAFHLRADLQRHKRTVHSSGDSDTSIVWICSKIGCSRPGLVFRRPDNYRRHLARCTGTDMRHGTPT